MFSVRFLGLNTRVKPLGDVRVRQALMFAIDRQKIVGEVTRGRFAVARGILPPGTLGYNPQLNGAGYDPARARALLAAAGYPGGRGLPPLAIWSSVKLEREHQLIVEHLAAVGSDGRVQVRDGVAGVQPEAGGRAVPDVPVRVAGRRARPRQLPLQALSLEEPAQLHRATRAVPLDALLVQARNEPDGQRRVELYRQAEQQVMNDAVVIPFFHYTYERVFQPYVKSIEVSGLGDPYIPMRKIWLGAVSPLMVRAASLQTKLLWGTVLVIGLMMAAVMVVVEQRQRTAVMEEARRRGEVLARDLAAVSQAPLLLYTFITLEQHAARLALEDDVRYAIVLDAEGRVAAHSKRPEAVGLVLPGVVDRRAAATTERARAGGAHRHRRGPRRLRGAGDPGQAEVGHGARRHVAPACAKRLIRRTRWELGGLTVVTLLLGGLGAALVARRISRPVQQLAEGAAAISRGELDLRIEPASDDEIGRLAVAFNHMAEQLRQQRAAVEGANAELRQRLDELADLKSYTDNILASLTNGIVTVDLDGRVVTLNPAAELMTGFFAGEVTGRYCTEVFAADRRAGRDPDGDDRQPLGHRRGSRPRCTGATAARCRSRSARRRSRAARARISASSPSSATSPSCASWRAGCAAPTGSPRWASSPPASPTRSRIR